MNNQEIARAAVIEIASEDEYWRAGDERLVSIDETNKPEQFAFAVAGTFGSDYGCVIVRDGKADVHYHDENSGESCQVCGWSYIMTMTDSAEDPYDDMYLYPPCPDCGNDRTCEACKAEDAYYEWMAERVERLGEEMAILPDYMECYDCARNVLIRTLTPNRIHVGDLDFKFVWRRPVKLGHIAEAHRDPTQTYVLECGHWAM